MFLSEIRLEYIKYLLSYNEALKNLMLAMISNILEMTIGVGLPTLFLVLKDGKQYAVEPDKAYSFYRAILDKWKKDRKLLVLMRLNELSTLRRETILQAHKILELQHRIKGILLEIGE